MPPSSCNLLRPLCSPPVSFPCGCQRRLLEGKSDAYHRLPPWFGNLHCFLSDLKITMQLPNMACKSLHALTPAHLHPHPPISRISSICSDLHLLQSFLPQSLCSGCSHLLEHSSLSQSPSLSLHIKVSVHILRQSLWPL